IIVRRAAVSRADRKREAALAAQLHQLGHEFWLHFLLAAATLAGQLGIRTELVTHMICFTSLLLFASLPALIPKPRIHRAGRPAIRYAPARISSGGIHSANLTMVRISASPRK